MDNNFGNNGLRSWVEISKQSLINNYTIYRKMISQDIDIMAVVKANAYGHGDDFITKTLYDNGVRFFAVSNVDEAIRIRKIARISKILVLGYTPLERIDDIQKYDITQALLSEEYAQKLTSLGISIKCQFAIDTGMRRIGLNADLPDDCERIIRLYNRKLKLDGLFTHLCVADTPSQNNFTEKQISLFENIITRVEDLKLPYCHCLNSAGGLWHQTKLSRFVRLGIILYGLKPDYVNTLPNGIKPILSWKSVISMVKIVNPGDTIGYGRAYVVHKPMRIATIPTGYADGYSRLLSNKSCVLINGKKAPIVGQICMDQMMVDVSEITDAKMNSEVVLIGRSGDQIITADDLASIYGTIGYEVVCGINKRVDRFYVD